MIQAILALLIITNLVHNTTAFESGASIAFSIITCVVEYYNINYAKVQFKYYYNTSFMS